MSQTRDPPGARVRLLPRADRNRKSVLRRGNRAAEVLPVGTIGIVGPVEIKIINTAGVFRQIQVPSGGIGFCAGRGISKWDEKRRTFPPLLPLHAESLKPVGPALNLELKVPVTQRIPHFAGVRPNSNPRGNRVPVELYSELQGRIKRVVFQTGKTGPILFRKRRTTPAAEGDIFLSTFLQQFFLRSGGRAARRFFPGRLFLLCTGARERQEDSRQQPCNRRTHGRIIQCTSLATETCWTLITYRPGSARTYIRFPT